MATWPRVPPHDRLFARVEKFQCVCPNCGRLVLSAQMRTKRRVPTIWNPYTQRLTCPSCTTTFVIGLLLFPISNLGPTSRDEAPPDTRPTRSERIERARLGGGFVIDRPRGKGEPVNHVVKTGCSCPPKGWVETCLIHGTPPAEVDSSSRREGGL